MQGAMSPFEQHTSLKVTKVPTPGVPGVFFAALCRYLEGYAAFRFLTYIFFSPFSA